MVHCKICGNDFKKSDSLVICEHKGGIVHLGCCLDNCSWNKEPCKHSHGLFEKID